MASVSPVSSSAAGLKAARRSSASAARWALSRLMASGVAPGLPHVRRADVERLRRQARAPPRAALCEVRPLDVGQGEVEVAEMALEGPAVVHLLAEGGACLAHPWQHEALR